MDDAYRSGGEGFSRGRPRDVGGNTSQKGLDMARQTERQRLSERFHTMKTSDGLTDMKFHLGKVSEATTEAVCAEVNRLLDNVESGKVQELTA